jgi:hypothetical protein
VRHAPRQVAPAPGLAAFQRSNRALKPTFQATAMADDTAEITPECATPESVNPMKPRVVTTMAISS